MMVARKVAHLAAKMVVQKAALTVAWSVVSMAAKKAVCSAAR